MRRLLPVLFASVLTTALMAAEPTNDVGRTLTLGAALKLAGAEPLDVQLAHERSLEARARHHQAMQRFFPWISPGLSYRRVDGRTQTVTGDLIDVDKHAYGLGLSLAADIELGDAIYGSLVTQRHVLAAEHATAIAREQATFATRNGYFILVQAQASVRVAGQALTLANEYASQVHEAVVAGLAFAGDESRAKTQLQRRQLQEAQASVAVQSAAARLAEILRLADGTTLRASDAELQPMVFVNTAVDLPTHLARALTQRPELRANAALKQAAAAAGDQADFAPLVPRITARAAFGGLGGGRGDQWGDFGATSDVALGIEWRFGPGGLFDGARRDLALTRERQEQLNGAKLRDQITREVQESYASAVSTQRQVQLANDVLTSAETTYRLTRERREFGVGMVLETIRAEEELTQARIDVIAAITRHNLAQAALLHALGVPTVFKP